MKRGNSWKIQRDVVLTRPVRESDRNMPILKKEGKLLSKIKFIKGKCLVCTVVTTKGNILAKAVNSLSHFLV